MVVAGQGAILWEFKSMNTADFAKKLREKYPTGVSGDGTPYASMSDQDLVGKVVEKYPTYKSQIDDLDEGGIIGSPIDAVKEFGSDIKSSFEERAGTIKKELGEDQNIGRKALRTAGQVGGLVGDLELSVVKLIAPKFAEDMASKGIEKISQTELAQNIMQKYSKFKEAHPEAVADLEDAVNVAALVPYLKGAQVATEGAIKGGQKAIGTISKVTDKVIDARRAANIAKATEEIDDVVGKIVQGKTDDILKAKKALSSIDTAGVKTYADLGNKIDDGVDALAGKVDELLETQGASVGPLKSDKLITTTKVGEETIKQNFVDDAIAQLDELYTKIKDAPAQAEIINLKNKLQKEGLTLKELNDLSRRYGTEFGRKAFSKLGDPLTSVNAQAYENTRKGVKKVVRSLMPDETVKMLDERMSNLLNTNTLVRNMEERVNALYQKAKKRGVLEQVARKTADVVDLATFHTLSGFLSRMLPSNVGLKVMNSIDLEDALNKNLKRLDKLLKVTNDETLTDGIIEIVRSGTAKQ
jgi:hypothetical protein